jgi:Protein of unknown function (DUF2958)
MAQKLLTSDLKRKIPRLYSGEKTRAEDKLVVAKFFQPWGRWTWYVTEGQQEDGDWRFFGYVQGIEDEWGYFMLSELEAIRGPGGLRIERDIHFAPTRFKDLVGERSRRAVVAGQLVALKGLVADPDMPVRSETRLNGKSVVWIGSPSADNQTVVLGRWASDGKLFAVDKVLLSGASDAAARAVMQTYLPMV